MKLTSGLVVSSLLCAARQAVAASASGHVYLYDPESTSQASSIPRTVRASTAEAIIARRLGLSNFVKLGDVEEEDLMQINAFGGRSQQLLGYQDRLPEDARTLIVVDGVEEPGAFVDSPELTSFDIAEPKSLLLNSLSAEEWAQQAGWPRTALPSYIVQEMTAQALEDVDIRQGASANIVHVRTLGIVQDPSSKWYRTKIAAIQKALQSAIVTAKTEKEGLTIAILPPNLQSTKTKRSAKAQREKPLTGSEATSMTEHIVQTSTNAPTAFAALPHGVIPACFASQSECESGTNNCTGHGSCIKKYSRTEDEGQDCYGCACKPEVTKRDNGGVKTTRYGGGACQKKDVVMPFWLLAGFTIGIIFLVTFAVGQLYAMGEEDLPSVIGAGVSGPNARK